METKEAFKTLGIPPTKDESIIKKAYRKKAMKYHPDKNSSSEAKEKFIKITTSYDILLTAIEQAKKKTTSSYSERKEKPPPTHAPSQRRNMEDLEERLRRARARYEFLEKQEAIAYSNYFHKITTGKRWFFFKILTVACALVSTLLIIDILFLPSKVEMNYITKGNPKVIYSGIGGGDISPASFDNHQKAWIPTWIIETNPYACFYLDKTTIFKEIKSIRFIRDKKWYGFIPNYSLIFTFPAIPLILLFPLFTFFIKSKTVQFMICFNISTYFISLALLIVLISNDRWLHLLSFVSG